MSFVFSLKVFRQYCLINYTFSFALMIQICDSSHMNISIFCFAFWQILESRIDFRFVASMFLNLLIFDLSHFY